MQQDGYIKTDCDRENIANILIVDNDPEVERFLLEILARKGIRGHIVENKQNAIDFISKGACDLVFANDSLGGQKDSSGGFQDFYDFVEKIMSNHAELPVIVMMQPGTDSIEGRQELVERTIRAIQQGCSDVMIKPLEKQKVGSLLDTLLPNHGYSTIDAAQEGVRCLYQIVGKSTQLIRTVELAKKIAPTSAPVLVSGESGTGKELIAYLIHQNSKRFKGAYIRINCAALSESLLESELFGHEKGAFTGAYTQRKGKFEMAHGGTLLLDEITETPIRFQAKLLRVLEQQDFERVGGNESVRVNVRIISTTNKNLLHEVRQGRFRRDLYYRLSAVRLNMCPLRDRPDDLSDLVWYFINQYCREVQRNIVKLDPVMMDIFKKYHWPGNVRQLRNVVRISLMLGVGPVLSLADVSWLSDELQPLPQLARDSSVVTRDLLDEQLTTSDESSDYGLAGLPLEQVERKAILETLRQTGGNQAKAAKVLGISDRTLRDRIHRYRKEGCLQPA
jgi:DNA-binding NtrC family response regulator